MKKVTNENLMRDSFGLSTNILRDETLEALSDAQYVAPAAKTVDLHSANHRNSFLYVFDYQTKFGDFPQVSKVLKKKICFWQFFKLIFQSM